MVVMLELVMQPLLCKGIATALPMQLPITNYQMALSKQGAGGGSATHKEPT